MQLPDHIWFVRSNGGSGSFPIKPEGRRVVRRFVGGVLLSVVASVALVLLGTLVGPTWLAFLAIPVFVVGMGWSAWTFIDTARKHTAYDITYREWAAEMKAAGLKPPKATARP